MVDGNATRNCDAVAPFLPSVIQKCGRLQFGVWYEAFGKLLIHFLLWSKRDLLTSLGPGSQCNNAYSYRISRMPEVYEQPADCFQMKIIQGLLSLSLHFIQGRQKAYDCKSLYVTAVKQQQPPAGWLILSPILLPSSSSSVNFYWKDPQLPNFVKAVWWQNIQHISCSQCLFTWSIRSCLLWWETTRGQILTNFLALL